MDYSLCYSNYTDYQVKVKRQERSYKKYSIYGFPQKIKDFENTETYKELIKYLETIKNTAITYAEQYEIEYEYSIKYSEETNENPWTYYINDVITDIIIPSKNIIVYDIPSLYDSDFFREKMFYIKSYEELIEIDINNLSKLKNPPNINLDELIQKNRNKHYELIKIKAEKLEKETKKMIEKQQNLNFLDKPYKTAPTLSEGFCMYLLCMFFVSIFNERLFGWIAVTIFFIIWCKGEIDEFNRK